MARHYNTSKYMAHWPMALPYPYEITRSRAPVPNASSVDWPQAQFAPLYLPSGSPSFQPYRYRDKPRRYPPGAKVFSIWPGPNTLKFSTKPMNERLRRQWMRRPDGDIIRVPQYGYSGGQLARPNIFPLLAAAGAIGVAVSAKKKKKDKEALAAAKAKAKEAGLSSKGAYADPKGRSADTWTVGHSINYEADKGWGVNLSDGCQAVYLERVSVAKTAWSKGMWRTHDTRKSIPSMHVPLSAPTNATYVSAVKSAQVKAVACEEALIATAETEEYEMLREHKVETQQTSSDQAMLQADLMSQEADLASAQSRNKLITYGLIGAAVLGGGFFLLRMIRK